MNIVNTVMKIQVEKIILILFFVFSSMIIEARIPFDRVAHNLEDLNDFNKLNKKDHYELFEVKGKVKSICFSYTKDIIEKFGEIVEDNTKTKSTCVNFNSAGKVINLLRDNNLICSYNYDNEGKIVEMKRKKDENEIVIKFYYNENSLLIKQDKYENGKLHEKFIYKYDGNSNPIEINNYNLNGDLDWKDEFTYKNNLLVESMINYYYKKPYVVFDNKKYTYDFSGKKTELSHSEASLRSDGEIKDISNNLYNFIYDSNNNLVSQIIKGNLKSIWLNYKGSPCSANYSGYEKDENGDCIFINETESVSHFKYDSNNNEVEVDFGNGRKILNVWNEKNKKINVKRYSSSKLQTVENYTFDSMNSLLLTKVIDKYAAGNLDSSVKNEFSYDGNENLITQKDYENGKIKSIEKRTYIYF